MISAELFWSIFDECVNHIKPPLSLIRDDRRPDVAEIDTGYNSMLSKIMITLQHEPDCFSVQLACNESMPFQNRVWEFLRHDKNKIESMLQHKPVWKYNLHEHRIQNKLIITFQIKGTTAADYKAAIVASIPDITTYLKIYTKYIRNLPNLFLKTDLKISADSLIAEIILRDNPDNIPYLINNNMRGTDIPTYDSYCSNSVQKLYAHYRKLFDWKSTNNVNFNNDTAIFIPNATKEGYDIWFIKESSSAELWRDNCPIKIYGSGKIIEETSIQTTFNIINKTNQFQAKRLIFVKTKLYEDTFAFKFLGIFEKVTDELIEVASVNMYVETYIMTSIIYKSKYQQQ